MGQKVAIVPVAYNLMEHGNAFGYICVSVCVYLSAFIIIIIIIIMLTFIMRLLLQNKNI